MISIPLNEEKYYILVENIIPVFSFLYLYETC